MIVSRRATTRAREGRIATAARDILERRAATMYPSTSLAVSDAVAFGIAGPFSSSTPSGRVFERLYRTGSADSDELLEAARAEQVFAPPQGTRSTRNLGPGWRRARTTGR